MYNPQDVNAIVAALQGNAQADKPVRLAGDVISAPHFQTPGLIPNTGPTPNAAPYAWGEKTAPNVLPINPAPTAFQNWLEQIRKRY